MDVAFVTSLSGYELGRLRRPPRNSQELDPWSPMRLQACSQIWFDPILKEFARSLPSVTLRHRCRLTAFEQSEQGVTAQLIDLAAGRPETVEADYLVGCDGANSIVRRGLGIELLGQGTIGTAVNLFFRKPGLLDLCGREPATFFLGIDHEGIWGNIRIIDPKNGVWRIMIDDADDTATAETVDRERYLHRAIGRPLDVEWLDVSVWRRHSAVAACYGKACVYLAGDAVHQLSPTGGLGMNTGVADAVDIGWKLAATMVGAGRICYEATTLSADRSVNVMSVWQPVFTEASGRSR
jgi:2-polyprenyl-6-methoxyphenol hydroxylase-like FAD-dependent oxidoreductase